MKKNKKFLVLLTFVFILVLSPVLNSHVCTYIQTGSGWTGKLVKCYSQTEHHWSWDFQIFTEPLGVTIYPSSWSTTNYYCRYRGVAPSYGTVNVPRALAERC